jgi:dihydroxycyclohexadiene carboxylate dehydrogenase
MMESHWPGRFSGKVAVVTGAAQGLGYAAAERLGREGASIVVADAAEGPALEAVRCFAAMGIAAVAAIGDLSSAKGAEAAMACAQETFGGLHVLVNNVGGTIWAKPFWHYTESEIRAEVDRTFWPTMWCSRAAISHLRKSGGDAIVNIGSNAATDGIYRVPYSACKGAIMSLTRSLAVELAAVNIRVNCLSPGGIAAPERKTPRQIRPFDAQDIAWWEQFRMLAGKEELLADFATAEQLAGVIAFLVSSEAGHITGEVVEAGRRGVRIAESLGFIP